MILLPSYLADPVSKVGDPDGSVLVVGHQLDVGVPAVKQGLLLLLLPGLLVCAWRGLLVPRATLLGLVLANNLLGIYAFWELVGLSSYLLIGHWFEKPTAADACKKAFITNRAGDIGMFIGIMILFQALGTFDYL